MSKLYVTESGHHAIGYAEFGFWQSFVLDAMQTSTDSAWDYYVVRNRTIICFTVLFTVLKTSTKPSVLWHCWLGVRKSIWPVKIEWWGVGVVICLEQGADCLHIVQLMPLHPKPCRLLPQWNPDWFLPFLPLYTVSQKKQDTKLLPITSPNVNRFSKFFHW